MPRTITVRGTGSVTASPDRVEINLNVEAKDRDYAAALETESARSDALLAAVREAGLPDYALTTGQFNVRADYESVHDDAGNWRSEFAGYVVTRSLRLVFPFSMDTLSAVLGNIGASEASPQLSIAFTLSDPEAVKKQALADAVRDAREKAEILASASGASLGNLLSIQYSVSDRTVVSGTVFSVEADAMPRMAKAARFNGAPQDIDVTDDAVFVWEIC